jgi:hypothetical protein
VDRIKFDGFYADIVFDALAVPETWHCIIQRQGCKEVLFWSQEDSRVHAIEAADEALKDLMEGKDDPARSAASIADKKFMTLHETTRRLRSRR